MKKLFSLLLVAGLLSFFACGGAESTADEATDAVEQVAEEATDVVEEVVEEVTEEEVSEEEVTEDAE